MRRWFLSYNSQDLALMQALEAALRRKDAASEIFFAPKTLRVGGYWLPELAKEIADATAFVLLVGPNGLGPWQVMEYYEALDRRVKADNQAFPIVLVLLEGVPAPGLPFMRQLNWIVTADPGSEQSVARLMEAADGTGSTPGQLWRHTAPYRGLAAMTEADSDFFFGRAHETIEVLRALEATPEKLPILLGNSGVGKSSLAQAGVLAALKRQAWPEAKDAGAWPQTFRDSRRWCYLRITPGTEPLNALVEAFMETWQFSSTDPARVQHKNGWIELLRDGKSGMRDLLDATERRYEELNQPKPPTFFLYVDQGEELYVRAEERQRLRFSEILAQGLGDPRFVALMSLRADFLGALQSDQPLFKARRQIDVPPLGEEELREVVSRPAALLSARFETEGLAGDLARRTAEESAKDAGALPLLSYLLDDMWTQMVKRGDGILRLPPAAMELGGVLAERANAFLASHPAAEGTLRRVLTLRLATVHEDGETTRRRALRSEFNDEEWRLVSDLADHPNRLLVTAAPEGSETYAEVAHEAIFRRWSTLREWLGQEREFLSWRNDLEGARRRWQAAPDRVRNEALLMGLVLVQARGWLEKREQDLLTPDRDFINASLKRLRQARVRAQRVQAVIYVLLVGMIIGMFGWINQDTLKEEVNWWTTMRPYMLAHVQPYVLPAERERALKPLDAFRECEQYCPEMVVIPAGEFMMGSPATEVGRYDGEGPQHKVTIAKPFAISKYIVTFDDWDACASVGGCARASDGDMGRGRKPIININWDEARQYAAWLSRMTGKTYRLVTESEWEYAARGGTTTRFYWGEELGKSNANCSECGWDNYGTSPVGTFPPNPFGLYDMAGNVFQWAEDCYLRYEDKSTDGSARTVEDCARRVNRSGSWNYGPRLVRPAYRGGSARFQRGFDLSFRIARTLGE